MFTTIHLTTHILNDPRLAAVGWCAGRRAGRTCVALAADLSRRRRAIAILRSMTDSEFETWEASRPTAERDERASALGVAPSLPRQLRR